LPRDAFGKRAGPVGAVAVGAVGAGGDGGVRLAGRVVALGGTLAGLPAGRAGALIGSRNRLEIVVRDGSAAARLDVGRGAAVVLRRTAPLSKARRSKTT